MRVFFLPVKHVQYDSSSKTIDNRKMAMNLFYLSLLVFSYLKIVVLSREKGGVLFQCYSAFAEYCNVFVLFCCFT